MNRAEKNLQDVMHFTAVLPEVDVKYVMEAFSAPLYRKK